MLNAAVQAIKKRRLYAMMNVIYIPQIGSLDCWIATLEAEPAGRGQFSARKNANGIALYKSSFA
jgi:hypothetical protein